MLALLLIIAYNAPAHTGALAQLVERLHRTQQVRSSNLLCSSLRFFGEKTSAWQAFRRAKLNLFMGRSTIKSGGCHAIARKRGGGPHPRRTPHPSNAQKNSLHAHHRLPLRLHPTRRCHRAAPLHWSHLKPTRAPLLPQLRPRTPHLEVCSLVH